MTALAPVKKNSVDFTDIASAEEVFDETPAEGALSNMASAEEDFHETPAEGALPNMASAEEIFLGLGGGPLIHVWFLSVTFWITAMPWAPQLRPDIDGKIPAPDQPDEILVYQEGIYAFTTWASKGADYAKAWVYNGEGPPGSCLWTEQPVDMHSIGWWREEMLKPVPCFPLTAETWACCQFVNAWVHALSMFRVKTSPNRMQCLYELGHYYSVKKYPGKP